MVGKGKRRREKNYEAAHGSGHTRLPPPPDAASLDAMPSKLRKLMNFSGGKSSERGNTGNGARKEKPSGEGRNSAAIAGDKRKRNDPIAMGGNKEHSDEDKRKKKKKKKKVADLRFEKAEELGVAGNRKKEHRKQRREAKKNKSKKGKLEDDLDFRGAEEIKFGDVVQAPPKLNAVPKKFKTLQDASQERLRLQAINAYRDRKGWAARPGVLLPQPVTSSPFG